MVVKIKNGELPEVCMLTTEEVMKKVKLPRSTIRYYIKKKIFPVPVKIGPRRIAWISHEINNWVLEKMKKNRVRYHGNIYSY